MPPLWLGFPVVFARAGAVFGDHRDFGFEEIRATGSLVLLANFPRRESTGGGGFR